MGAPAVGALRQHHQGDQPAAEQPHPAAALGLDDETRRLLTPAPLTIATLTYAETFHRRYLGPDALTKARTLEKEAIIEAITA